VGATARARGISSWVLLVLGGLAVLVGIVCLFLRQEVLDPEAFAGRAASSLDDASVRDYIAERLTQDVVEGADSRVLAARPLIEGAIAGVVGSSVFRPIVRGAAAQLYGALATQSGGRVALGLTDAVVLATEALRSQPGAEINLPKGFTQAAIDLGERKPTQRVIQAADGIRVAGLALPAIGVALLAGGVAVAARRRRAVAGAGAALAIAGAVIALGLPIGKYIVERQIDPNGTTARDAAGAVWQALLGDLANWAYAAMAVGLVVWLTAASVLRRVPLPELLRRAWGWAMSPPRRAWPTVGRGVLLIVVAILLAIAWDVALYLAVLAVAVALAVQGMGLILGVLAPTTLAAPGDERMVAVPRMHVRRRTATAVLAALTVLLIAGGVALGTRGPASYGDAQVTACNGYAELCDRPVNEVAFAATHNAMSAADQPGWFRAEHRYGIPAQLRFGIRGFLIDAWYGIPAGNLVASDFDRSPDDSARAQAFNEFPDSARQAFLRLRSRLGFKRKGASHPYLCHVFCEAGATDMIKGLGWFRQFLEKNPGEVVVLDIEDYISPDDIRRVFADSGLLPYVYRHPAGQSWPTLGEMIESGQRVIVMTEHHNGGIPWILPAYRGYLEETPYKFTLKQIADPFVSCRPHRGGTHKPFFLLNNWIESSVPSPDDANKVNAYDALLSRALTCERERGHIPNLVAVDFYRTGDVLGVVNVLNDLPRGAKPAPS
jgi:hypothetical protein